MLMRVVCCMLLTVMAVRAESIKTIHLQVSSDSLQYIYDNYSQDTYIPVTFSYQGETWAEVSMRIRGDGSREFPKKSLKLRFDDVPFVNGRDRLNLNAEYLDMSFMHAVVSSELYREAGIPCFEAEHVLVYLNGEFWGVYVLTENMDEQYLEANGLDPRGLLYKAWRDGACMNLYEDVTQLWEIKNNVDAGWKPLQRFIHELNHVPEDQFVAWLQENVDLDNYYSTIIMNALLGSGSTYYHNYFMYKDVYGSGKWMLLPWDLDQTLGTYHYLNYPITRSSNEYNFDNPWAERAWIHPETRAALTARLHEIGQTIFNPENVFPRLDSLQTLLHPWVLIDQTDQVETSEKFIKENGFNYKVVEQRYAQMVDQLENWPQPFAIHRTHYDIVAGQEFELSWNASASASGNLKYEISISKDRRFNHPETIVLETTGTSVSVDGLEPGLYFWRVYAENNNGKTLGFSKPEFFEVVEATPFPTPAGQVVLSKDSSPYVVETSVVFAEDNTLIIEPGVEILLSEGTHIEVHGVFEAQGTASDSIVFTRAYKRYASGHDGIHIHSQQAQIQYCLFEGARSDETVAASIVASAPITVKNSTFQHNQQDAHIEPMNSAQATMFEDCEFIQQEAIERARVQGVNLRFVTCDVNMYTHMSGLLFADAASVSIESCRVYGGDGNIIGPSAQQALVTQSEFDGANSIFNPNTQRDTITYSTITVADSALVNCDVIDHVTLWNNTVDISHTPEHNTPSRVSNTILQSVSSNSELNQFYYCLSPTELKLDGIIAGTPNFVDPIINNFFIQEGSAAVNAGDPLYEKDPDGSVTDIGARWFDNRTAGIVINEINYKSSPQALVGDWVELHNPTSDTVHMSGWKLTDGDEGFTFPANFVMHPQEYIVVVREPHAFALFFGGGVSTLGSMNFGLSGQGETVYLKNQALIVVDSVAYDDNKPWPEAPDGEGPTLELIHPSMDNNQPLSWQESVYDWGTPGRPNSVHITDYSVYSQEVHVYPNPATVGQTLGIETKHELDEVQQVYITDVTGAIRANLTTASQVRSGEVFIATDGFAPGYYMVVVVTSARTIHIPFVLL